MIWKKATLEAPQAVWSNVGCHMYSEREVLNLLAPFYSDVGENPADLIRVIPSFGGWLNALHFLVVRADDATTCVSRADLDTANRCELVQALQHFELKTPVDGPAVRHRLSSGGAERADRPK
jgi:hypothetical protein